MQNADNTLPSNAVLLATAISAVCLLTIITVLIDRLVAVPANNPHIASAALGSIVACGVSIACYKKSAGYWHVEPAMAYRLNGLIGSAAALALLVALFGAPAIMITIFDGPAVAAQVLIHAALGAVFTNGLFFIVFYCLARRLTKAKNKATPNGETTPP